VILLVPTSSGTLAICQLVEPADVVEPQPVPRGLVVGRDHQSCIGDEAGDPDAAASQLVDLRVGGRSLKLNQKMRAAPTPPLERADPVSLQVGARLEHSFLQPDGGFGGCKAGQKEQAHV
jgi:hypothetical protein